MNARIKIYVSPYKLNIKFSNQYRRGWLLLFDFGKDLIGYSDFLPWPSFGELSGEKQLQDLKIGKESSRLRRAKEQAFMDAKGRQEQRNLCYGLNLPSSHLLIEDLYSFKQKDDISNSLYKVVKVKLKPDEIKKQIQIIKEIHSSFPFLKWRFDFNGQLSSYLWRLWKKKFDFLEQQIDFIEDPFSSPLDFQLNSSPLFAEDWNANPYCFIRIAKPSRDSHSMLIKNKAQSLWKRVVFTHSFDHPLGQVANIFYAAQFYKIYPSLKEIGGFKCLAYEENEFIIPQLSSTHFTPPSGFGFGFQNILSKQQWKKWI